MVEVVAAIALLDSSVSGTKKVESAKKPTYHVETGAEEGTDVDTVKVPPLLPEIEDERILVRKVSDVEIVLSVDR
jgi:hypothetical protein